MTAYTFKVVSTETDEYGVKCVEVVGTAKCGATKVYKVKFSKYGTVVYKFKTFAYEGCSRFPKELIEVAAAG